MKTTGHARQIWEAWLDGKTPQVRESRSGSFYVWSDRAPTSVSIQDQPQNKPEIWRINPEQDSVEYYAAQMYYAIRDMLAEDKRGEGFLPLEERLKFSYIIEDVRRNCVDQFPEELYQETNS